MNDRITIPFRKTRGIANSSLLVLITLGGAPFPVLISYPRRGGEQGQDWIGAGKCLDPGIRNVALIA